MSLDTIIEISFAAIFTGGLATLFWARSTRLEAQIIDLCHAMATKGDVAEIKAEVAGMRQKLAVTRSDLTHVALAIGVNRRKPAEG